MDLKEMTIEQLEERKSAIVAELDSPEANLDALEEEARAIKAELEARAAEEAKKAEIRSAVAHGAGTVIENKIESEERKVNTEERKAEMIDALAEYIKGRATPEQRALLSTNVDNGTVLISDIVDDYIWTDWDKSPLLSRVRKTYVKGNYTVGYEESATGAVIHTEGDLTAPAEEVLTLGYVTFIAQYFKKWITVSDTVLALKGQAFMDYLMDEFGHQLAIALENAIINEIKLSSLTANVTNAIDNTAVMAGFARLSDEATNPVVIISKATYASIMNERATTGAKIEDPFNGLEVLFNNTVVGLMVGDLDGIIANFPDGEDFKFIIDDKSMAEHDMVKIVGKILADVKLVRPNGFAWVQAPTP